MVLGPPVVLALNEKTCILCDRLQMLFRGRAKNIFLRIFFIKNCIEIRE